MATDFHVPYEQILQQLQNNVDADDKVVALFRSILDNATLRPEEQMILEMLVSLGEESPKDDAASEHDGMNAAEQVIDGEYEDVYEDEDDYDGDYDDGDYNGGPEDDDVWYDHARTQSRGRAGAIERMQEELADLREVNDTWAAATGSCKLCFGGDDTCHVCHGQGGPGWRKVHPELFEALIVPIFQRGGAPEEFRIIVRNSHRSERRSSRSVRQQDSTRRRT